MIFGHSFGGATTLKAMNLDDRFKYKKNFFSKKAPHCISYIIGQGINEKKSH